MLRLNNDRVYKLQGDMSDTDFAKKIGISRSQLWRIRNGRSSVGGEFIEKFMAAFPDEKIDDIFLPESAP